MSEVDWWIKVCVRLIDELRSIGGLRCVRWIGGLSDLDFPIVQP